MRWSEVAPVIDYHVVVDRYDVTNKYMPADNGDFITTNKTWAELTLSPGRYRAMIQAKSFGKYTGAWSEPLIFSIHGSPERGDDGYVGPDTDDPPTNEVHESTDGTKIDPGQESSLVDSANAVWTFGAPIDGYPGYYEVMRNGVYTNGWGSILKVRHYDIYHRGGDGVHWWPWDGSGWVFVGPTER